MHPTLGDHQNYLIPVMYMHAWGSMESEDHPNRTKFRCIRYRIKIFKILIVYSVSKNFGLPKKHAHEICILYFQIILIIFCNTNKVEVIRMRMFHSLTYVSFRCIAYHIPSWYSFKNLDVLKNLAKDNERRNKKY